MAKGAPKKYTRAGLRKALDAYFRSITREDTVRDLSGTDILNMDGEPVKVIRYIVPPSVADICLRLGISKSTWENYARDPKTEDVVQDARLRMEARLARELSVREGKDVRGVIFELQNNYGYTQKQEVELGENARKAFSARALTLEEKLDLIREGGKAMEEDAEEEE